ncbi:MAG TPA: FKBP-type peptidyl-prolyl cis-trans isomerase [Solirubrobacteraceae bacterium]
MRLLPRHLAPTALALAVALSTTACGSDDKKSDKSVAAKEATATPEASATATAAAPTAANKDTSVKPEIAKPSGDPPTKLVTRDIVKGKGAAAKPGDQVTVQYVGVSYSTGQQFDASWDNGQPFPFNLGAGEVIPGWDKGVKGMKVGGRRELIIPPDLAYGPAGSPPAIQPNETLIFVVDLLNVQKG